MKRKIFYLIFFALIFIGEELWSRHIPKSAQIMGNPSVAKVPTYNTTARKGALSPVVRVVDGDTIVVEINGAQEKIRLIGVNTPEIVDPRKQVECFGKESSVFAKDLLSGKSVRIEPDMTQGDRDKYGRLLRFVFLPDGTLVNKKIIREGYGHEYTYRAPYRYQAEFKEAERLAREEKRGLWGNACEKN